MSKFWTLSLIVLIAACHVLAASSTAPPITMKRNDRIVIVGGGPAGIHYATLLSQKGFTNITVLEASPAVGGKSKTVMDPLGFPHELGTCYAHALYQPVFDLLKTYDPTNTLVPFIPTISGHTLLNKDGAIGNIYYNTYILLLAMQAMDTWDPPTMDQVQAAVQAAFLSYVRIHMTIFGAYAYGLPPQPSDWSRVSMSGYDFLVQNNLLVLEGFFRFVFQQQGYGSLENTPAFYMLWWAHPDVIRARVAADSQNKPWVFMLSRGYQSLWQAMVRANSNRFQVFVNTKVTKVTRSDTVIAITVTDKSGSHNVVADHIVYAVDLSRLAPLPTDLTPSEKLLFQNQNTASAFVVTLFESDSPPVQSVSVWWPERGMTDSQGRLQLTRNSRLALFNPIPRGAFSGKPVTDWGINATGRQANVAYQYYNRLVQSNDGAVAEKQLLSDLDDAGFDNANVRAQVVHNYFPRYNQAQLQQGIPWKIWNAQGNKRTTWIGSSVSFESVLDVLLYNNQLIQRVQIVP
ncbi:Aste57867_3273 [Aphanomyces stellatus]|uniref:Aste57867_3273 protein n=1 Tax=Aphanomyces stellatus TaxID=120398 RepID=A0A485K9B6_9STRA|nr:hypothetical protein As57867_003263 [Aphanomyces stellatus]VFT80445.1 Aste57867_3273 [Aphanomyces stellatus]